MTKSLLLKYWGLYWPPVGLSESEAFLPNRVSVDRLEIFDEDHSRLTIIMGNNLAL